MKAIDPTTENILSTPVSILNEKYHSNGFYTANMSLNHELDY